MKKYLVEKLAISPKVIFIEPYARHTVTNLRNVNRIIYSFGIPAAKPVLLVTDSKHTSFINGNMAKRAIRDLGYIPYRNISLLDEEKTVYYPSEESMHINHKDPLDP